MSEHLSPSGKYRLTVESTPTKPGCWDYTSGTVLFVDSGEIIATVRRNYSSFPFLFIEDHPNGHDYLITGEDYQGQTVIELDTGRRKDFLPPEAEKGAGFCWADYAFNRDSQILVVEGCHWACPYEFRFYDFSDPMERGWPEILLDGGYFDVDVKAPTFNPDGTITCYTHREEEIPDGVLEAAEDEDVEPVRTLIETKTVRREGDRFVLVGHWVDPAEQARREAWARAAEANKKMWEEYRRTDPMYLHVLERIEQAGYKAEYMSHGICYDGWHPDTKYDDQRVGVRFAEKVQVGEYLVTVHLDWGKEHAPVKLTVYQTRKDTSDAQTFWFEHSRAGIDEAFDRIFTTLPIRSG